MFKVSNFGIVIVSGVTIVSFVVLSTSDIPKILLNSLVTDNSLESKSKIPDSIR